MMTALKKKIMRIHEKGKLHPHYTTTWSCAGSAALAHLHQGPRSSFQGAGADPPLLKCS